jgi:CRP-like cAMP-binding protein
MPKVPDVSAIVESVKARIKHIEDELARHERLSDELERLRDALGRLEGAARSHVGGQRDGGRPAGRSGQRARSGGAARSPRGAGPASRSAASGKRAGAAKGTATSARAPRGQNKAKVLEALDGGPKTASEIADATGIATGTVSTLLTKLSKSGEVVKAERGYRLPDASS